MIVRRVKKIKNFTIMDNAYLTILGFLLRRSE